MNAGLIVLTGIIIYLTGCVATIGLFFYQRRTKEYFNKIDLLLMIAYSIASWLGAAVDFLAFCKIKIKNPFYKKLE